MTKISRALISVSDKVGLVEFARGLASLEVKILSTGGTFKELKNAGVPVTEVSEHTGSPEILDGRVKTLHPKIHGGILARRADSKHMATLEEQKIAPIDLVVVNLYPFEKTAAKSGVALEEAIEQIDIGGPSMIRSAAKNHESVAVIVDPKDYSPVLDEMKKTRGEVSLKTRRRLAVKAFSRTAQYDAAIAAYLAPKLQEGEFFSQVFFMSGEKITELRYGENPHQKSAFYKTGENAEASIAAAERLNGKAFSFNNILDLDAALSLAKEFSEPAAVVIKHNNPCGCAIRETAAQALAAAWEGDPLSAFGSVVALNRELDEASAEFLTGENRFVEAVIAPEFSKRALEILTKKPKWGASVRLLQTGPMSSIDRDKSSVEIRKIYGGFLVQTPDDATENQSHLKTVSEKKPTSQQIEDLLFAQIVAKHTKSNAITLVKDLQLVGFGAGQTSRVDSVKIAVEKAGPRAKGAVLGSDAFFPFPDGIEAAANVGVLAVVQPGGSVRDAEVIAAANRAGMAMVFTGVRHFWH